MRSHLPATPVVLLPAGTPAYLGLQTPRRVLPMMASVLCSNLAQSFRVHFRAWLDPLGSIFEPGSIP